MACILIRGPILFDSMKKHLTGPQAFPSKLKNRFIINATPPCPPFGESGSNTFFFFDPNVPNALRKMF